MEGGVERQATVHVSDSPVRPKLEQAAGLLQDARYKQAIRILDELLAGPVALVDRLQILARRALAHALWKKPELAIDDATAILNGVQADIEVLIDSEIDWEYEKAQDIGHLAFLADVYQLRGVLWLLRHNPQRAVEDLTLSIYMTSREQDNLLNYLQRALALIELQDCLGRAIEDLGLAWHLQQTLVQEWLHLPESGEFVMGSKGVAFRHEGGEIQINPDKARLRINRIGPHWFRLKI